jgi:hypothetical protein
VRRLTWVCGPERVLAEEVIEQARGAAGESIVLVAGDDREPAVWAACAQPPADPAVVRLVVIRRAERLRAVTSLPALVRQTESGLRVLFHAETDDFPYVRTDAGRELAPHVAVLRDSAAGLIVRATRPSKEEDLAEWAAQRLGDAGRILGQHALACAGGDLRAVADLADKLERAGLPPTESRISLLCERQPGESYADLLVLGRRDLALEAARTEPPGPAIGLLSARLHALTALYQAAQRRLDARDTALQFGVDQYVQRRFRDVAGAYGPPRVASCRSVLAAADDAWRGGETTGVLEFVAALW